MMLFVDLTALDRLLCKPKSIFAYIIEPVNVILCCYSVHRYLHATGCLGLHGAGPGLALDA